MSVIRALYKMRDLRLLLLAILPVLLVFNCLPARCASNITDTLSTVEHPEWSCNLSIYEVNLRQYSQAGTFREFEKHLPRLKEMGVGILWLMPIHPIGEKNRKGTLGSYYSVKDYLAVSSEYGSMDDFKSLVEAIHDMGMYVIIDWVANHTAWDNSLTVAHPDWYMKDEDGNFIPPVPDWSDVIDLNYDKLGLWDYMIDAMKFWVEEVNIDGFRCDVAGMVPMDFWNRARAELEKLRPVFMLAEDESPACHEKAFDMTYSWKLYRLMNGIAQGKNTANDIAGYFQRDTRAYPKEAYRMYFTTNHDENSWNGTASERLGDAAEILAVLAATVRGMPLVYSGQEAGLDKRLEFFEKDSINWKAHEFTGLYTTLLNLKKRNKALWNGDCGGEMVRVPTSNDAAVFAFIRELNDDRVFVVLNLSDKEQDITLSDSLFPGNYTDVFAEEEVFFAANATLKLRPWEYRVFEQ